MSEALKKLNQKTSKDSRNAISSPVLESGPTCSDLLAGPMTDLFGQAVAPVQVSQQRAKAKGLKTLAISGLVGLASSASQDLQQSLESKLIKQLDSAGSTLFKQTWKRRVTPLGRRYLEHTASALRTGDSAFTSLPTPRNGGDGGTAEHYDLSGVASLSTVVSPQAGDADRGGQASRYLEKNHAVRLNDQAMLSSVPTPMAGTPTRNGYNEAGSTDYERKMDVALGLRETANGPKLATAGLERDTKGTGNLTDSRKTENRQPSFQLSTLPTPKSTEHQATQKRGNLTLNGSAQLATVRTPTSEDGSRGVPKRDHARQRYTLDSQTRLATVTTPTAQDHSRGNKEARPQDTGVPLSQQAALSTVSTPSSRDWKDTSGMSESGVDPDGSIRSRFDQLPRQAQLAASGLTATGGTGAMKSTGQLAPDYSRWLQGLPPEWDDCAGMATQSLRPKRKHSSKRT
jgi:hypothetical protein